MKKSECDLRDNNFFDCQSCIDSKDCKDKRGGCWLILIIYLFVIASSIYLIWG